MARTNKYLSSLCAEFEKINSKRQIKIPFFTVDEDFQFFKKPIVKDFLAFFKIILNDKDGLAFNRIAKKFIEKVDENILLSIRDYFSFGVSETAFLQADTYAYFDDYYSLLKAYDEGNLVVYDTETTGLDLSCDEIIQLSAIKIGKGKTSQEFNEFILPTVEINDRALKTHGYSKEYILSHGGRDKNSVLYDFQKFVSGCVLVGHNSRNFDDNLLLRQASESGISLDISRFFDTLLISEVLYPDMKDRKLSTLCEKFGVKNERAHDGFSDVVSTKKCLEYMIESLILSEKKRREIYNKYIPYFSEFYKSYSALRSLFLDGDILKLFGEINSTFNLINKDKPSELEASRELFKAVKEYAENFGTKDGVKRFITDSYLSGSQIDLAIKKSGKIPLLTVHQTKGMEFRTVILVGATDDEIPSYQAKINNNDEEEKRIFYVALSRGKEKFYISFPSIKRRGNSTFEQNITPYVKFLPPDLIEFK